MTVSDGLPFACEKFSGAVHLLATSSGDVQARLREVFTEIAPVQECDIPSELLDDFRWITQELTRDELQDHECTPNQMTLDAGVEVAKRICDLSDRLDAYRANHD